MSTAKTDVRPAIDGTPVTNVDMKVEVVVIPVSDVERARAFYVNLGWRIDADVHRDDFRLVQLTPPGSGCSVQFGTDITPAAPGSAQWVYLVVSDIKSASAALAARGVHVSEVFHEATLGDRFHDNARVAGPPAGRQLRLVRRVQRSRWQYLAPPGGHSTAARPYRRHHNVLRISN